MILLEVDQITGFQHDRLMVGIRKFQEVLLSLATPILLFKNGKKEHHTTKISYGRFIKDGGRIGRERP